MKRIFWGLALVGLGVILTVERVMGIHLGLSFWSVVLTLVGGSIMWGSVRKGSPSWLGLALGLYIGGIGLFDILHAAQVSLYDGGFVARNGWPVLLIAVGLSVIFGKRPRFRYSGKVKLNGDSRVLGELRYGQGAWVLDNDLKVEHGIGDVKLDLTTADITEGIHNITVNQWVGEMVVRVPDNVSVTVDGHVHAGELHVLGDRRDGVGLSLHKKVQVPDSKVELRIDANLGVGSLRVVHGAGYRPAQQVLIEV